MNVNPKQQDGDDNAVGIFISKVWQLGGLVHQPWMCVSTKHWCYKHRVHLAWSSCSPALYRPRTRSTSWARRMSWWSHNMALTPTLFLPGVVWLASKPAALNLEHPLSSPMMMTVLLPWALCVSTINPKEWRSKQEKKCGTGSCICTYRRKNGFPRFIEKRRLNLQPWSPRADHFIVWEPRLQRRYQYPSQTEFCCAWL